MAESTFQIQFSFGGILYFGLVREEGGGFNVNLEIENREAYLQILLTPSPSASEDWKFTCGGGEDATLYYDKGLLQEVGERIEAYLNKTPVDLGVRNN